jgi:hypothetical protein
MPAGEIDQLALTAGGDSDAARNERDAHAARVRRRGLACGGREHGGGEGGRRLQEGAAVHGCRGETDRKL